jgi:hypothetical protein
MRFLARFFIGFKMNQLEAAIEHHICNKKLEIINRLQREFDRDTKTYNELEELRKLVFHSYFGRSDFYIEMLKEMMDKKR